MWRRISHAFRTLCYWGFPAITASIGVYLAYRATLYDGSMSERAYAIGVGLILGTWAWTASRSSRRRSAGAAQWEDDKQALTQRVRELERRIDDIMRALKASDAAADVLDALQRLSPDIPHRREDQDASVIRLDPNTGT